MKNHRVKKIKQKEQVVFIRPLILMRKLLDLANQVGIDQAIEIVQEEQRKARKLYSVK